jgi:hypothetical protein
VINHIGVTNPWGISHRLAYEFVARVIINFHAVAINLERP